MIEEKELQHIQIVLGDTLKAYFTIDEAEREQSSEMFFVCKDLHLNIPLIPYTDMDSEDGEGSEDSEDLPGTKQVWVLWYEDENLRPGTFYYDLIEKSEPNTVLTLIYHGRLTILPKVPPKTTYNPYYEYPHNTKKEHE